ncbi:hypothetical protein ENSA5_60380 [Enhygromyxa salina]|uniref:DUF885 domain-containing protein n=1 Tax=Enhygromyxa salina TaxID=215803 RepID=A0A2S9XDN4_9BACT|nr:DUF885 family protein [Enhygromyxa salina]PRP90963.1 hypothetical protein ENSA5_60380 [Enhygromyxa salina]
MSAIDPTQAQAQSWRRHLSFEPEEARMLGLEAEGRKSLARLGEQIDVYRELATAPDELVSTALRRLARLAVRRFDRGDEHVELERVMFARLGQLDDAEGYVRELTELFREGLARGHAPPLEKVTHYCEHELPAILDQVEADSPWREFNALLRDEALPAARERGPERWRLGAEEYSWRLANMNVRDSPEALVESARAHLREQQATIAKLLDKPNFQAALPRLRELTSVRLEPGEVIPAYREAARRCVAFVREHQLFDLPEDFELPFTIVAPEMAAVTHAGNDPAPLFGEGGGSFAVLDDPERHRRAWVAPLSVHEGVPGHYLQSWLWQRRFRASGAAPNFISIADLLASERQDWGAMPAIEGWAVYSEDLMLEAGFHAPEQAVAVANFHAIRCARAIIDAQLHTRDMSRERAAELLVDEVGLDHADTGREILRCIRIPTQPLTYFAGWRTIAGLVEDSGLPLAEAHARLLACGPSLPKRLV